MAGSQQQDVEVSYGVSNEFFKLILDTRMNYTSGIFTGTDNLDVAQEQKLRALSQYAHVNSNTKRILDIGCGWGSNLEYNANVVGVEECVGVTLSPTQGEYILQKNNPKIKLHIKDFREFQDDQLFDAAYCIEMSEHWCTPEETRAGKNIPMFREFFKKVHSHLKPGAYFSLQTILRVRVPRNPAELKAIGWVTNTIFPNAIFQRMEDYVQTAQPMFEAVEMRNLRHDYRDTCWHWLQNLNKNKEYIIEKWGRQIYDDYKFYFETCVMGFEKNYLSEAQWCFKKLDY